MNNRLTNSGITLGEVIKSSFRFYRSPYGDDKIMRAKVDILNAKITVRNNLEWDQHTKKWNQTGRDVKFTFMVKSDPISYKRTDSIKNHIYPVTFIIHDWSKGLNSTFKYRSGSLKKPIFKKPGMTSEQVANKNILAGIDLWFFFHLEWVLWEKGLLWGRNWATYAPKVTNPKKFIYLDKHGWFCLKILMRIMTGKQSAAIGKLII